MKIMKSIKIYVDGVGSTCNQEAKWIYYLNYENCVIKRTGNCGNYTYLPATLQALINAIYCVKEPCKITIYSKVELGFKNTKRSHNKTFLIEIQKMINNAGHLVEFIIDKEFKQPKQWEEENKHREKQQSKQNNQTKQQEESKDWREMYSDLMGSSGSAWVPGSGGY